jgi:tocopherol cyclase
MGAWSYLPIFEPGWQILMSHGLASGWVEWRGRRFEFEQAPAYAEKNWGQSFPRRWFWIQCNAFPNHSGLSLTCAGAERQVLTRPEEVALISLHGGGSQPFLEWRPGQARLTWQVDPWGSWQVRGVVQEFHLWIGWPDLPSPGMDPVKPREPPWPHT